MKIAITDYSFPNVDVETSMLSQIGHEVVAWKEQRPPEKLIQLVHDADAVITQFATVNADVIASMTQAKVIVRYGIGVDNVDLDAARSRGIPVCNVPDYCIDEVADQTLAFLLSMTRQIVINTGRNREGKWGLAVPLDQMKALRDMTVGIVGFGRIGREVALRLKPFKCRLLVHDPVVSKIEIESAGGVSVSLADLLASADAITLHCPSNANTRGMINRQSLSSMKRGAMLVNVARGDLVESAALMDALHSGQIAAAALDVFAPEPIPPDHPLLKMENVIVASHIASCSVPAVQKLRQTAATIASMALRGEPLPNVVNGVS